MAELQLEGLTKSYAGAAAVHPLDLAVEPGEFLTLLGPSGCGKSTTLAMIAGLEQPDGGRIGFRGTTLFSHRDGVFVPPEQRDFGLVFQSYALWPHLTVEANLAFALKLRRVGQAERKRRVAEALELVDLAGLARRFPGQLSGGQQQRVSLARAIVYQPRLLLLDEPLSNLDALLREQARIWLKDLQSRIGMTTICVTHDQIEALSLSDRVVVMQAGRVVQVGTPRQVYAEPTAPFVAEFIGASNFLHGVAGERRGDALEVVLGDGQRFSVRSDEPVGAGATVVVAVRVESLEVEPAPGAGLAAELGRSIFLGERFLHELRLGADRLRAYGPLPLAPGPVSLHIPSAAYRVFRHR